MYEKKVAITTTIPEIMRIDCKNKGVPLQMVFMRGFQALNGEPQLLTRTRELTTQVEKLNLVIENYRKRILELENVSLKQPE
jgi:hypothetical protein